MRVGLAGGTGFGSWHRQNLARLAAAGRARLVGVADPAGRPDDLDSEVDWYPTLTELLIAQHCDVVIVATPIHTHTELSEEAMRAGAHVYLEKPPVPQLADFHRLLAVAAETGRSCQVGFQALGSDAVTRIADLVADGAIGKPQLITGYGAWTRTRAYFDRSAWSGRRRLGDRVVADGVATNALAHSVAQGLRLAGISDLEQVASVTTELYKANLDNESDDTTWVRIEAPGRLPVSCALTLCAPGSNAPPTVEVTGDEGRIELEYTTDRLTVDRGDGPEIEQLGRIDLVENLLDHLAGRTELISPLASAGAYTTVLAAIQAAEPMPITDAVVVEGSGADAHPVIKDVEYWTRRAADSGAGYAAAGAPWATEAARHTWTRTTT